MRGDHEHTISRRDAMTTLAAAGVHGSHVRVRCRPESGGIDQACGLLFRLRDSDSYYITRALTEEMTRGWVELHFDVVDQRSPGMRPGVMDAYTPKLDLELDLAFFVFSWLPAGNWLRAISVSFLVVMPLAPLVPQ